MATAHPLTSKIHDYDWVDELLHVRIGREWLVPELGSQKENGMWGSDLVADSYRLGQMARSRSDAAQNLWPELYRRPCLLWGIQPHDSLLAFNRTYETSRANLKQVAG